MGTFCCLLDDTTDGNQAGTIPANGAEPVTGHILFDLGRPLPLRGARLVARHAGGPYNPRRIDLSAWTGTGAPNDADGASEIVPLVTNHRCAPLTGGASTDLLWDEVVTRYVALRVKSSYESGGPVHYNYQIAEMQFFVAPKAEVPAAMLVGGNLRPRWLSRIGLSPSLRDQSRQAYGKAL